MRMCSALRSSIDGFAVTLGMTRCSFYLVSANRNRSMKRLSTLAGEHIIGIMSAIPIPLLRVGRLMALSTEDRVQNIVVELLGVDKERVVPAARFREDLEADSLDLVELIMKFEEEFGGEITDDDAQKITSVGEAVSYIQPHMGGA